MVLFTAFTSFIPLFGSGQQDKATNQLYLLSGDSKQGRLNTEGLKTVPIQK